LRNGFKQRSHPVLQKVFGPFGLFYLIWTGKVILIWAFRLGTIPDTATARIRSAAAAQLETWALNILDAETLDGVFGE